MAIVVFEIAAEPNTALAAAAANAASPAAELRIALFEGPNWVAKAVLPFSFEELRASPSASLELANLLQVSFILRNALEQKI